MSKKVIISESHLKSIVTENIITEAILGDPDFTKKVKSAVDDAIKSDKDVNKAIEKKVKELVARSVSTLFKTLWQRRNFYEDDIKKG